VVSFYADEQFPLRATQHLKALSHDVKTVQEANQANRGIPDNEVLAFATAQGRAVLTLNRRDFIRLHRQDPAHAGIVVVKDDLDKVRLAERIHNAVQSELPLTGKLVRVTKKVD
jgi:predicted nuclease of predicted toxin-antitoxin system